MWERGDLVHDRNTEISISRGACPPKLELELYTSVEHTYSPDFSSLPYGCVSLRDDARLRRSLVISLVQVV